MKSLVKDRASSLLRRALSHTGNRRNHPKSSDSTDDPDSRVIPKDRVVERLRSRNQISPEVLDRAIDQWNFLKDAGVVEPFWRIVARQEGADGEAIMLAAAAVYGFRPIQVSLVGTLALMDALRPDWPQDAWARLVGVGMLPVIDDLKAEDTGAPSRLVFATPDPMDQDARSLADELAPGTYDLRFFTKAQFAACLREAKQHLPEQFSDAIRRIDSQPSMPEFVRRAA